MISRPSAGGAGSRDRVRIRQKLDEAIACIEKKPVRFDDTKTGGEPIRVSTGLDILDQMLSPDTGPSGQMGIITNALHEVRTQNAVDAASAAGFALCLGLLMARGLGERKAAKDQNRFETRSPQANPSLPVFWIADAFTRQEYGAFYGPGLAAFGLAPENLIRICPQTREGALWAAGEIAATGNAAGSCIVEIHGHPKSFDLKTSRRLMLRAQAAGTPVILLRQSGHEEAGVAATRWHVGPAPSATLQGTVSLPLMRQFIGPPAFHVRLEKCRGAHCDPDKSLELEWNPHDQCFAPFTKFVNSLLAADTATVSTKPHIGNIAALPGPGPLSTAQQRRA